MDIIGRISTGSRMDQIYIPKNRSGFRVGNYVVIKPIETQKNIEKPYFYSIKNLEPIKTRIVDEIFKTINKTVEKYNNIIITGSFLDEGFNFNDIDILLITEDKISTNKLRETIKELTGAETHIILLNNQTLIAGLATDPLYQTMLSKCISKKRLIYNIKRRIDYKILDLHLLKSKTLIDNFDILDGAEKYYLARNMVAIFLYIQHKKISKEIIDHELVKLFHLQSINEIKKNMLDKNLFLKEYKIVYDETFNLIMKSIKHGSK